MEAEKAAVEAKKELPKLMAAWEANALESLKGQTSSWSLLEPTKVESKYAEKGATLTRQQDGSWLASGPNPDNDVYVFDAPLPKGGATGFLLECLPDASLPNQSLGRNSNGNFVLTSFDVYVQTPGSNSGTVEAGEGGGGFFTEGV